MRVAVIGGGIAGLVAADRLTGSAEVVVFEGSPRCGGKLAGADLDGIGLDVGAESMLARRPEAVALAHDLGLGDLIVHPTDAKPGILVENRRRPLPPSLQGVPTDPDALGALLSAEGWQRARAEPDLAAPPLDGDLAIGAYVDQRFGSEVTDRLLEPLLAGVYAGRSRELSFAAVAHGLFEAARGGGSLTAAAAGHSGSGTGPVFAGIRGGVHHLIEALQSRLADAEVEIRTETMVRRVERDGDRFRLELAAGDVRSSETADAVVVACPATAAGRLLSGTVPSAEAYGDIPYASVAVVTVVVRDVALEGSGLLLPPGERSVIKAVTHSSRKWDWVAAEARERWGEGVDVVRLSVGRLGDTAMLQVDDPTLLARTFAEAQTLPGWEGAVLVRGDVTRWGGGLPQYRVGHRELVARLRAEVAEVPGLAVCGAALDGLGIPACVSSADKAVRKLMEDWAGERTSG